MPENIGRIVSPVGNKFGVGEASVSGRQTARDPIAMRRLAVAVLHGQTLFGPPIAREAAAQNSAVVSAVPVVIDVAFPRANSGQVRRAKSRDAPLSDRIVGNTKQSDFSVGPRLARSPLDRVIIVCDFPRRARIEIPWRFSAST